MTLLAAVGYALTGDPEVLGGSAGGELADVPRLLARAGWDDGRLAAHAADVRERVQPWPHPVPAGLRGSLGAAQLQAAVDLVVTALGLDNTEPRPPAKRRPLNADERRLLADVPPHW